MEKDNWYPSGGDLVFYRNDIYYFEPAGNTCYLYKKRDDIGNKKLASHAPSRRSIRKPTRNEMERLTISGESKEAPLNSSFY